MAKIFYSKPFGHRFYALLILVIVSGCKYADRDHTLFVSVPDQEMRVFDRGKLIAEYPVSTSKFGLGDAQGSHATPLGRLRVRRKIGDGAPLGAVFKSRQRTGEIVLPNSPGRDPVVTRILWLEGLETQNRHSFARMIYIHGTPEENRIGFPASFGCIRMKSADVISLYDAIGVGAEVTISPFHLSPLAGPTALSAR